MPRDKGDGECTHSYGVFGAGCMPWCKKIKSRLRPKRGKRV